jgi:hypothetical protein
MAKGQSLALPKGLVEKPTPIITLFLFRLAFFFVPENSSKWLRVMQDEMVHVETYWGRIYWGYSAVVFALKKRFAKKY